MKKRHDCDEKPEGEKRGKFHVKNFCLKFYYIAFFCLRLIIPTHRKAFTSIMFSSHGLAVERLRWKEHYRAPVPREWRLCRFCRSRIEDEVHAILECQGDCLHQLAPLRETMRMDVSTIVPDFHWVEKIHGEQFAKLWDEALAINDEEASTGRMLSKNRLHEQAQQQVEAGHCNKYGTWLASL